MSGLHVRLSADGGSVAAERDGSVVVDGRLHRARDHWEVELVLSGGPVDGAAVTAVLDRLRGLARAVGPAAVQWLVSEPTPAHDEAARGAGLTHRRDLLQLRRPLPVEPDRTAPLPAVTTRAFRPGHDEAAWLTVNNRSFADHPDQSRQTAADLTRLEREPWFEPEGFRLLDADPAGPRAGELDGFCWTKVHADHQPPLGEIFVIGVDPSAHGRRLGPALTVAGLDHLAARGITVGMLYVDEDNAHAVRMYGHLGFTTHHVDRIYRTPPASP